MNNTATIPAIGSTVYELETIVDVKSKTSQNVMTPYIVTYAAPTARGSLMILGKREGKGREVNLFNPSMTAELPVRA